ARAVQEVLLARLLVDDLDRRELTPSRLVVPILHVRFLGHLLLEGHLEVVTVDDEPHHELRFPVHSHGSYSTGFSSDANRFGVRELELKRVRARSQTTRSPNPFGWDPDQAQGSVLSAFFSVDRNARSLASLSISPRRFSMSPKVDE